MSTEVQEIQRAWIEEREIFDYTSLDSVSAPTALWKGDDVAFGSELERKAPLPLPDLSEADVARHFYRLSQCNYGVDSGLYPLGSCTMKYNPKYADLLSSLPGFTESHPYEPVESVQGLLELMYMLEKNLASLTGLDAVTLQPAAGAHGELTGLKIIKAAVRDKGRSNSKVLIPDSAHGTNPASSSLCGFTAVQVKSGPDGRIDMDDLASKMDDTVAAVMITNPNTLGIFESNIRRVADMVHRVGGYLYCDGANLNALMGKVNFSAMGVDVLHMNLHKTFATPHGGGGPGSGPVAVTSELMPYLPVPRVVYEKGKYVFDFSSEKSIGRVKAFYGNFLVMVRAYAYILSKGAEGLKSAAEGAVLNANYLRKKLSAVYHLSYESDTLHECVFNDKNQKEAGVTTMDIAKRLMDFGFHPPTVYFPLIVKGAMMIEPTETETCDELDRFVAAMLTIDREAREEPDKVKKAPHNTGIKRVDETAAARRPDLRRRFE